MLYNDRIFSDSLMIMFEIKKNIAVTIPTLMLEFVLLNGNLSWIRSVYFLFFLFILSKNMDWILFQTNNVLNQLQNLNENSFIFQYSIAFLLPIPFIFLSLIIY